MVRAARLDEDPWANASATIAGEGPKVCHGSPVLRHFVRSWGATTVGAASGASVSGCRVVGMFMLRS